MRRFMLDTSVLIERERLRTSSEIPDGEWCVSAITLSEINVGVLTAESPRLRQRRLATFESISDALVLPFDEPTARTHAELVAWARSRGERPSSTDGMIAATAATNGLLLVTIVSDFKRLADFDGLDVVVI